MQIRHVIHGPLSGMDRAHAWQEATGEPVFLWGRGTRIEDPLFFGPLKKSFSRWISGTGGEAAVTVYHDGIGSDALGPLDPSPEKILFLHNWFPRWQAHLEWSLRCTGKLMVADESMVDVLRAAFSWIPRRFIGTFPQPGLQETGEAASRPGGPSRRTGIWLHGRSWRPYGNRLRAIVDRWDFAQGELEIICEGNKAPRWSRRDGVTWSVGMPTEFALHRLFTWDSTLLLNDYSLDAPWLLRALTLDCFPLVPDGDSPARAGLWEAVAAPSTYEWGDVRDACRLLGEWRESREQLLPDFHKWREQLIGARPRPPAFRESWQRAVSGLSEQRTPRLRKRRPVNNWQLVSWYERVFRLRSGI